jgi:PPOX class probable F420-dependent enzyme
MGVELSAAAKEFLGEKVFAHVATLMEDGSPQATVVWVETDGTDILFNSARPRQKTRNMMREPRIAMSIMGMENSRRNLYVRGVVKEITAEGANDQATRLSVKYRNRTPYPFVEGEQRLTIRVEPISVHERNL